MNHDMIDEARGLLERPARQPAAPLVPTAAMCAAPVHIAFVSWRQVSAPIGEQNAIQCVIAVASEHTDPIITVFSPAGSNPMDGIVAEIVKAIAAAESEVWVNVPRKRKAVASMLSRLGVPVSIGCAESHLAMPFAIEKMQSLIGKQHQALSKLGSFALTPAAPEDEAIAETSEDAITAGSDLILPALWWPSANRRSGKRCERLVLASDASTEHSPAGTASLAALSSNGDIELATRPSDTPIGNLEVAALVLAISIIEEVAPDLALVLCDSQDAVALAHAIVGGLTPQIGFRGMSRESIGDLALAIDSVECPVQFVWVKGHGGHPLNEAVDKLANVGRLASKHPQEVIHQEMDRQIETLIGDLASIGSSFSDTYNNGAHDGRGTGGFTTEAPAPLTNNLGELFGKLSASLSTNDA